MKESEAMAAIAEMDGMKGMKEMEVLPNTIDMKGNVIYSSYALIFN